MIKKEGVDGNGDQHWVLLVPEGIAAESLEVRIIAKEAGLRIGDDVIPWDELIPESQK